MTSTPTIDSVIEQLKAKGIKIDQEHKVFDDSNRIKYTKWYKNKLRKTKRNLLNNLPKQDS
nr:MAG TPA: hypothetical protein [Caudoviricetes sp.]